VSETIIMIVLAGVSIVSLSFIVYQRVLLKGVSVMLMQTVLDKTTLETKFTEHLQGIDKSSIEQTQGFVKFLSESRDWAFTYIEKVQSSIANVKTVWESESVDAVQLDKALEEMFSHLPENTNKENNE